MLFLFFYYFFFFKGLDRIASFVANPIISFSFPRDISGFNVGVCAADLSDILSFDAVIVI